MSELDLRPFERDRTLLDPCWLIWSNEHGAWWKPRHAGYTEFKENAGRYTYDEAIEIVYCANASLPPDESRPSMHRHRDSPRPDKIRSPRQAAQRSGSATRNMSTDKQKKRFLALRCDRLVRPDWLNICMAYDEAAEHLEICAGEEKNAEEKAAYLLVASRIRAASNRVRPNVAGQIAAPKTSKSQS